jgi:hypothetical protein
LAISSSICLHNQYCDYFPVHSLGASDQSPGKAIILAVVSKMHSTLDTYLPLQCVTVLLSPIVNRDTSECNGSTSYLLVNLEATDLTRKPELPDCKKLDRSYYDLDRVLSPI